MEFDRDLNTLGMTSQIQKLKSKFSTVTKNMKSWEVEDILKEDEILKFFVHIFMEQDIDGYAFN